MSLCMLVATAMLLLQSNNYYVQYPHLHALLQGSTTKKAASKTGVKKSPAKKAAPKTKKSPAAKKTSATKKSPAKKSGVAANPKAMGKKGGAAKAKKATPKAETKA